MTKDGAFFFMLWVATIVLSGFILRRVDTLGTTYNSANQHIFHAWCREHNGEIVVSRDQELCVRNRNLDDRLTMPDYFKIHGRNRE